VGDPDLDDEGAAAVRGILTATGARDEVERRITAEHHRALAALDRHALPPDARAALHRVADTVTHRNA
jgi:geranylgeranyl diphosphate synthase type I